MCDRCVKMIGEMIGQDLGELESLFRWGRLIADELIEKDNDEILRLHRAAGQAGMIAVKSNDPIMMITSRIFGEPTLDVYMVGMYLIIHKAYQAGYADAMNKMFSVAEEE